MHGFGGSAEDPDGFAAVAAEPPTVGRYLESHGTSIRDTSRPVMWLILGLEFSMLFVGFFGVGTALPQDSVPIGSRLVARDLQPFGQDLSVGITLSLIGAIGIGGSLVLARLRVWWAVVTVFATAFVVGFLFLGLAGLMVSGVFI